MTKPVFSKPFTQQEPIPEAAIERAVEVMRSGRLHRYNLLEGETGEAAKLEQEYAAYMGQRYCLACSSGGYALHIALKAAGLKPGEPVLSNAFTLAPVPGAIDNAGGKPVLVEIGRDYCVDLAHLEQMMQQSKARFFILSHMRGHIADMDAITALCQKYSVTLIEDCAHTMGASWDGRKSGTFGKVGCFSTQTYKHLNSGEGGLLTTDDDEVIARAIIYSGSYMLYQRHGTLPEARVFDAIKLDTPNYSGRMDNLRAAILRAQLPDLEQNCARWNERYRALEARLRENSQILLPPRPDKESYVGSSLQFRVEQFDNQQVAAFIAASAARGVELKWFGGAEPHGFTSRYDSWRYIEKAQHLPQTLEILATTFDLRIPLTFSVEDMALIGAIIDDEVEIRLGSQA
ncbi:MAG: aminotransferase class I/II-fold pyridoxal phosphate-dependent enzyme [Gammaproteobacteria bacterium]|nr:aminotransferase class I/II-fold pyridoxal phosphate-dependent enzyme [Gammaproteobacteria bacterium]MDH3534140.1 aminotransferase class I/II-fold pyridoxal phosphate-dependent enzyme [Gammaproteobacteria bacterium]